MRTKPYVYVCKLRVSYPILLTLGRKVDCKRFVTEAISRVRTQQEPSRLA